MPAFLPAGFRGGFLAPFKGWTFLWSHRGLLPLAVAPFLINLLLFALLLWLGFSHLAPWVRSLLPLEQGWWWVLIYYLLAVLLGLFLLAAQVYLFAVVGGVIASPFLEALTRRVEALAAPGAPGGWSQAGVLSELARVAGQALKRLLLYAAVMLALLALNLLPVLGSLLYAVLALLATCVFLALEFLDYPLDRRGLSLGQKLGYLRGLGARGLGFGAAVCLLGLAPLINLMLLPLAAVGGTLLYLDSPLPDSPPSPPRPDLG
ncbi:MAG: EI24 domain-containing protein [Pseudomonadota bacterium]